MNNSSLGIRLAGFTFAAASCAMLVFGLIAWSVVSGQIHRDAGQEAARQVADATGRLAAMDQITGQQLGTALRILRDESAQVGMPTLSGTVQVGDRTVPDLHLGSQSVTRNYAVVDRVKELSGSTATLFVWDGTDFVRVSTNVLKPDGSRAIGTVLDHKGAAFPALLEKRPFSGVVEILGVPYTTSYVPMQNSAGELVGAWYTGYRLDSIASLTRGIEEARILEHGFIALLKPTGAAISHGRNISDQQVAELVKHPDGWVVVAQKYEAWGYTVIAAYPASDVRKRVLTSFGRLAGGILLLVGAVAVLQFFLLKRLVSRPILALVQDMDNADLNSSMRASRNDEIGRLAESFNAFVARLRQTLFEVHGGSIASTTKSGEIRDISCGAVSLLKEQLGCAEDVSASVAQLSGEIADSSRNTEEARQCARSAADEARTGETLVESTAARVRELAMGTEQSARRISTLSERVEKIGTIVVVIEEIASSTNLLSLNASIEAARAGEHGRGFAVVAGEVRRLAERTARATREVEELVRGIQAETGEAAAGIMTVRTGVHESAEAIDSLSRRFQQISSHVIEVDGRIEKIADAARGEASAANVLSEKMRMVATAAKDSSLKAEQIVDVSGQLQKIARDLEDLVDRFHLRASTPSKQGRGRAA